MESETGFAPRFYRKAMGLGGYVCLTGVEGYQDLGIRRTDGCQSCVTGRVPRRRREEESGEG